MIRMVTTLINLIFVFTCAASFAGIGGATGGVNREETYVTEVCQYADSGATQFCHQARFKKPPGFDGYEIPTVCGGEPQNMLCGTEKVDSKLMQKIKKWFSEKGYDSIPQDGYTPY